jgi:GT2 family glycosyltransferase
MNEPKVSIIVPIHNGKEYTLRFLSSIKELNYSNYEVIIIDDGSTDGSADSIKELFPDTIILKGDGDFWWAKSMNVGVEYALKNSTDYILTLNNDNEVCKEIINAHLECSKKFPDAILGSIVFDKKNPDRILNGGGKKNYLFPPNFNFLPFGKDNNKLYQHSREVDAIAGMGTFIPVKVFKEIGLYNHEVLPQYQSCIEHTLRAQKYGYKLIFNPAAKLWNNAESSWFFPKKINPQSIKDLLFHKKSGYLLKAQFYMYSNYWPKFIWVIPFSLLYIKCIAGIILYALPCGDTLINLLRKSNFILKKSC